MKSLFITFSLCALAAASFAQTPMIGNCTVLPANNIWNTPIDTLPVSANSATYINTIGASTGLHPDFGSGTWNGAPIGIPFITVPGTQTKYPVTFSYADESDPGPYAIPLNAPIEGGSGSTGDRHAISIDTDNCVLYELYSAYPQAASWQAGSGIVASLTSNALRPAGWTSADAAGLPIFPGLARYDEVAAGQINHALRFTVPNTLKAYIWPARHYASSLTDPKYPPMGQRFRLKASFDITPYPADVQVVLKALKKYGMIIADNGSAWYISGAPDSRWNNDNLSKLKNVLGSNFEAVDVSSLMVDPNSGQAKQPGNSVTVTPGSATVTTGATQQFSAAVQGASDQSVTWAVNGVIGGSAPIGFISATGLYTAPAIVPSPATVTVQATSIAMPSVTGSATVTVQAPVPVSVTVSPASARVRINRSVGFTATVSGTADKRVTWQVNGITGGNTTVGRISSTGVYTAPSAVPSSSVTVRAVSVADSTKSATAAVTVVRR